MEKKEGAGSLWNPGNWHFERKNYTNECHKILKEKIRKIRINEDGIKLENSDIKKITGEAEINIRKGKQIFIYEFEVEIEFTGISNDDVAEGTYIIKDLNPFDEDYELEDIKFEEESSIQDRCKKILKKSMKAQYVEICKHLAEDIMQQESDPEKIKQAQELRDTEWNKKTNDAREKNGELKQQIFEEQKQKELQKKMENMKVQK